MVFIFLVCIGEAVFIVGLLVPSLPILLLTGGLIAAGKLPFWPIYIAAVLGAVIGDAISYWIGHYFKDRIKAVWPFKNYLHLIAQGEEYFHKHGALAIFVGRFITGVKAVIPGVAGMLGMPWGRFSFINIVSAFVWAAAHILPGMFLAAWLESIGAESGPLPRRGCHWRRTPRRPTARALIHHPHSMPCRPVLTGRQGIE